MSEVVEKPTLITLEVKIKPEPSYKKAFIQWQSKFNAKVVTFPGFLSLECVCPVESHLPRAIVERFVNSDTAKNWFSSEERKALIDELKTFSEVREISEIEAKMQGHVSEMFIIKVNEGYDNLFREWCAKVHQAEAHFPGFRGVYVQSPREETHGHWVTILQFDTVENLDAWLVSSERKNLLEESSAMIGSMESNRIASPYSAWFASVVKTGEIPPVWKQTMVVLLVLFPIVALEIKYLSPLLYSMPLSLSTFIGNAISVSLISFPMMPLAIKALQWWLLPGTKNRMRNNLLGIGVVLGVYALEIAVFWNLLS